jgi:hypothetical protein
MTYLRSSSRAAAARAWADFASANAARFEQAGLPALAASSVAHWDDLLAHGRFEHHEDPTRFTRASLTDDQYAVFVGLVESYFLAGYEYFTPRALKIGDQQRLAARFGGHR